MAQVALAWVLQHPVVSAPIVGATKPHHLADAVAALDVRADAMRRSRTLEDAVHAAGAVGLLTPVPGRYHPTGCRRSAGPVLG